MLLSAAAAVAAVRALCAHLRKRTRLRRLPAMVVLRKAPIVLLQGDTVQQPDCSYEWVGGDSDGLPAVWEEDLLLRRN